MKTTALALSLFSLAAAPAFGATKYVLTVTNGGVMPLSPSVVYAKEGQTPAAKIGAAPTRGFVQLCQTGNPSVRAEELKADRSVKYLTGTMGLIMPGETRSVEVDVENPLTQSVHFEAMYGKTKDSCAIASVGSHSLYGLKQHVSTEAISRDQAVQTGAFLDPVLPAGRTYLDGEVCEGKEKAVDCLRDLALANQGPAMVRFVTPYSANLQMLLETKYGASEAQSLVVPSAGAVQLQVKLKH